MGKISSKILFIKHSIRLSYKHPNTITKKTIRTMFGTATIGSDILDIGTRKFDQQSASQYKNKDNYLFHTLEQPKNFPVPNVSNPASFCRNNFASTCGSGDSHQEIKHAKGTTTLAFKFNDGI